MLSIASSLPPVGQPGSEDELCPEKDDIFEAKVEAFLAAPAPALTTICKKESSLPVLRKQRRDLRKGKSVPLTRPETPSTKTLDPARVAEAMAYAQRFSSAALQPDEDQPRIKSRDKKSHPITKTYGKSLRQSQQIKKKDEPPSTPTRRRKKSAFDPDQMQALVRNFESGTTVQELRKQLHDSQKAMYQSRDFIAKAAKSFKQHPA